MDQLIETLIVGLIQSCESWHELANDALVECEGTDDDPALVLAPLIRTSVKEAAEFIRPVEGDTERILWGWLSGRIMSIRPEDWARVASRLIGHCQEHVPIETDSE